MLFQKNITEGRGEGDNRGQKWFNFREFIEETCNTNLKEYKQTYVLYSVIYNSQERYGSSPSAYP